MLTKCRSCTSKKVILHKLIKNIPLNIWPQKKIFNKNFKTVKIYICKLCGQIQLQKITKKNLTQIYTGNTYNFNNHQQNVNRIQILSKRYDFINKNLLDIGGGTNPFLNYISNANKWVSDYKINNDLKNNKIKFIKGDFINQKINQKFDYIFLFHTLEHLENTYLYLEKVKKLLNDEGRLIIEVPNSEYDLKNTPYYIFFHMHITVFYKETLINLLQINGFRKEAILNENDVLFLSFKKNYDKTNISKQKLYLKSVKIVNKFSKNIKKINDYFVSRNLKNIGIFGAGGSSNLLISNSNYLSKNLHFILDNDINKENLYLFDNKVSIVKPSNKAFETLQILIILNENHKTFIPQKYRKKIIYIKDIINE